MFYFISGTLAVLEPSFAVIDAGGVGYKLTITQTTYQSLYNRGASDREAGVRLYTYMAVREDGIELFGFGTTEELEAFKLLITVSGVGPKAAMSILSQLTPQKLSLAICTDDKKSIAMANGIGPKTAARIVLELKDKLQKTSVLSDLADYAGNDMPSTVSVPSNKLSDAQDALMALGYSRNEAYQVLRSIDTEHIELDEIIRLALKKIMK
ncbi:MAG: Holliday junction branch migration protein RuvA [Ruminococcaceae bacterium]|nr:Holliday junction branch migration protein RuvA [Oscillospiraceae bacterium]